MDDDLTREQDDVDYTGISLVNLPVELLVKILSYLSTRDKINAQYVSRRLNDVSEIPLLWKTFLWHDYEPRHMPIISNTLKAHSKHVRQIFFPAHATPANILEMVQCCTKVTHLSLPRRTQLSLDDMEKILHMMTHLQQLDVFTSSIVDKSLVKKQLDHYYSDIKFIENFLEVTTTKLKIFILRNDCFIEKICQNHFVCELNVNSCLRSLEELFNGGHTLPSIIKILINEYNLTQSSTILESWSSSSYTQASLEIYLYDIARVPMDIYPPIPLRRFQFGPGATPPLIKLSDHGIFGLEDDMFYLSDYDHYGEVRHSVTHRSVDLGVVKNELHCIGNLCSVSNVDFCAVSNVYPNHLEQLAIACPNLHRLNLMRCDDCLRSLQGLRAIVDTCKNLQGLNLVGIPVSQVESYLLLWELLSSVKKLTHLAIGLCMLTQSSRCDDADKQKLIGMLRSCDNLKALEVSQSEHPICNECENASNVEDLLCSNFPSLVYVKLSLTQYITMLKYVVTNCRQLKYLCCENIFFSVIHQLALPSSISCGLQQLCVAAPSCVHLSTSSVQVLSAHGELEKVILLVNSITTCAITTLITNSPNLILLHVYTKEPLCDENGGSVKWEEYMDTVPKTFPCHKLLTAGDFIVLPWAYTYHHKILRSYNTNLNSLWTSV